MNSKSRNFPAFEATSLLNKFKQLWLTETEAKLVFETRDGQAWGSLHVCLGEHPIYFVLCCILKSVGNHTKQICLLNCKR